MRKNKKQRTNYKREERERDGQQSGVYVRKNKKRRTNDNMGKRENGTGRERMGRAAVDARDCYLIKGQLFD